MSIEKIIKDWEKLCDNDIELSAVRRQVATILRTSLEEYGKELLETPIGASNWLNHGIKYGYLDYFNFKTK